MTCWDGFVYNVLTMGVIFPWAYLLGPALFPGANIELAILLALLAQLPISLSYSMLATVLPVSGGDYVYQSRAFGKWGFICVFSGFVVWILQWIALSGWLFATLGLAPFLLSVGVARGSAVVARWGVEIQQPGGVFAVSLILAVATTLFLARGLKLYVRAQNLLFLMTIAAVVTVICVFYWHRASFPVDFDGFVCGLSDLGVPVPSQVAGTWSITPKSSFLSTLGVVPIVWTSLQWATYSVEQNTEIVGADHFRVQILMLVASAIVVALLLILVAYTERVAVGPDFINAAAIAYDKRAPEDAVQFFRTVLQPFPSVLAMAVARSILVSVIVALGFIANAFQVTCNSFIGVTRILVAMARDGMFPRWMGLDRVSPSHHAPVRALWTYCGVSVPVIAGYSFIPQWKDSYTLGVTFGCGYVFAFTCLAASRIPSRRMRSLWMCSEIFMIPSIVIRTASLLGVTTASAMALAYLFVPKLRATGYMEYLSIIIGIVLLACLVYALAESREDAPIEATLERTPSEARNFYIRT